MVIRLPATDQARIMDLTDFPDYLCLVIHLYIYLLSPYTQDAMADGIKRSAFDQSMETVMSSRPVVGTYIVTVFFNYYFLFMLYFCLILLIMQTIS